MPTITGYEAAPKVYMTPRCAEVALAAGITAVHASVPAIGQVCEWLGRYLDAGFEAPTDLHRHPFVMRWAGGGGSRLRSGASDTTLRQAAPNALYLNAGRITQLSVAGLTAGGNETDLMAHHLKYSQTCELDITDWRRPKFATQLVLSILLAPPPAQTASQTIALAPDPLTVRRYVHAATAAGDAFPDGPQAPFQREFAEGGGDSAA